MRVWLTLVVLMAPGLAAAVPVKFSGSFNLLGTGSVSGVVDYQPIDGVLFPLVNAATTDGVMFNSTSGIAVLGEAFDTGWTATNNPGEDMALWNAAAAADATGLLGDRLLFVDFEPFGGFAAGGGTARVTEFICQVSGCTGFDPVTTFRRTGDVQYTVPEPGIVGLMGIGLLGLALGRRRRI